MKYLSVTAWWNREYIGSCISDKMYRLNLIRYTKEYNKAKRNMSNRLIYDYRANNGYHDWIIKKIELPANFLSTDCNVIIVLQSPRLNKIRQIKFNKVKKISISKLKLFDEDTYMVDEWLPCSGNMISFELLTAGQCSLSLVCEFVCLM